MKDPHLSTSSSNSISMWRRSVTLIAWMLVWLVLVDIAVSLLFSHPRNPGENASSLQRYFEYGRSIEGKLDWMVGETTESSDPIVETGWLDPEAWKRKQPASIDRDSGHDLLMTAYGMSFTHDLCSEAVAQDGKITFRHILGPAAPPNHSYRAFELDHVGHENGDVAVFGILASSLRQMGSLSGLSWSPEHPAPFTYPRYSVPDGDDSELQVVTTGIETESEFRRTFLEQGGGWKRFCEKLQDHDIAWSAVSFQRNYTDLSPTLRLIKRAWGNRSLKRAGRSWYDSKQGFDLDVPELRALPVLIQKFASKSKESGQLPVVVLFNDQGYRDHLHKLLIGFLETNQIEYISTHDYAPASDASNFIGDGHFAKDVNEKLGKVLLEKIR